MRTMKRLGAAIDAEQLEGQETGGQPEKRARKEVTEFQMEEGDIPEQSADQGQHLNSEGDAPTNMTPEASTSQLPEQDTSNPEAMEQGKESEHVDACLKDVQNEGTPAPCDELAKVPESLEEKSDSPLIQGDLEINPESKVHIKCKEGEDEQNEDAVDPEIRRAEDNIPEQSADQGQQQIFKGDAPTSMTAEGSISQFPEQHISNPEAMEERKVSEHIDACLKDVQNEGTPAPCDELANVSEILEEKTDSPLIQGDAKINPELKVYLECKEGEDEQNEDAVAPEIRMAEDDIPEQSTDRGPQESFVGDAPKIPMAEASIAQLPEQHMSNPEAMEQGKERENIDAGLEDVKNEGTPAPCDNFAQVSESLEEKNESPLIEGHTEINPELKVSIKGKEDQAEHNEDAVAPEIQMAEDDIPEQSADRGHLESFDGDAPTILTAETSYERPPEEHMSYPEAMEQEKVNVQNEVHCDELAESLDENM